MKAYTLAELAVSLTIVFVLLFVSIFFLKSFAPSSTFKSDKNSISSKLTQAAIAARNPSGSEQGVVVRLVDKQLTIFTRDSEGTETKDDNNPVYLKSDSVSINSEIVFEIPSAKLKNSVDIELKVGNVKKDLHINELGIINE